MKLFILRLDLCFKINTNIKKKQKKGYYIYYKKIKKLFLKNTTKKSINGILKNITASKK